LNIALSFSVGRVAQAEVLAAAGFGALDDDEPAPSEDLAPEEPDPDEPEALDDSDLEPDVELSDLPAPLRESVR
jgi:hypothetical protein